MPQGICSTFGYLGFLAFAVIQQIGTVFNLILPNYKQIIMRHLSPTLCIATYWGKCLCAEK